MTKKQPLSKELIENIERQYDTIYTLGHRALYDTDSSDSFKVKERFGIDLENKRA